jgi:hypothetical protein
MARPKTAREVLVAARKLLTKGWTQGEMSDRVKRVQCYCAAGAVNKALGHNVEQYSDSSHPAFKALLNDSKVKRTSGSDPTIYGLTYWNDKKRRTQEQVIALFDRTIAKLEKAEANGKN